LIIPSNSFYIGSVLNISLIAKKGEEEETASTTIEIGDVHYIPFEIECLSEPCFKYSHSTKLNFNATSLLSEIEVDPSLLYYEWSVIPEQIDFISFQNQLVLLSSESFITDLDKITI